MNNEQYEILTNKIDRIEVMVKKIYEHLKVGKIDSPKDLYKAPGINKKTINLYDPDEQAEDTSGQIQEEPGRE